MSIILKGIDIPKDCWECQMFGTWEEVGKFSCFFGAKVKDIDIRAIDCPLIEIPIPHGRLIDEQKVLLTNFEIFMCEGDYKEALKLICEKLDSAPTILEAEE